MFLGVALRRWAGKLWMHAGRRRLAQLRAATLHVRSIQHDLLREKLALHAESQFALDHRLRGVTSLVEFRRRVPIAPYSYYEPYIDQLKSGKLDALLGRRERLLMFAVTSGTSSARKLIPVTRRFVRDYRSGWLLWGTQVLRDHPEVIEDSAGGGIKRILQLAGNWNEFQTPAGVPCGAISGLMASMQRRSVRSLYCLPPETLSIADPSAKYYMSLRLSVAATVGHVVTANPSTLITLARLGNEWKEELIRDIAQGTLDQSFAVGGWLRDRLRRRIARPDPARARQLERIIETTDTLYPKDYWPGLALVGTWTGGTVGAYLNDLPRYYGAAPVRDIGLLASEGRMTIPLEDGTAAGVLDFLHAFYEFIPRDEVESPSPSALEAHELQEGRDYFILPTTSAGLYRYHIHDVVRCVGYLGQAPLLEFLNKGSQFSSLTGEKLSEHQVVGAVRQAAQELNLSIGGFVMAPCWADPPYYVLLVEQGDATAAGMAGGVQQSSVGWLRKDGEHRLGASRLPKGPHLQRPVPLEQTERTATLPSDRLVDRPESLSGVTSPQVQRVYERLAVQVEHLLDRTNCEYHSKRSSCRLGPVQVRLVPPGTWQQFDARQRLQRGGSLEQYKHPCLIGDLSFLSTIPVLAELPSVR